MRIEGALQALEAARQEAAKDALGSPSDRSAFGYGFAVGVQEGFNLARAVLMQQYEDAERKDAEL